MSVCCSICTETLNLCDEEISVLKCGHLFHKTCIQQWLDTRMTCPECRCKVAKKNIVQKVYPSKNEAAEPVYRGSSDETKSILKVYEDSTKNLQKLFTKRIVNLEIQNKQLAEKNSKLEENINSATNTVRSLQEEKVEKDEIINKLIIDNEKLKVHIETFEKNELAFESLQSENKKLKKKLSSILNNILSDDCLNEDHSLNTSLNSSTKVKPESSIQLPSTKSNKLSENDRLKNEFSLVSNSINNLTQTPTCSTKVENAAIVVADPRNKKNYQYLLDEKKWAEINKFPKSVGNICGIYEINNVIYVVDDQGISTLNNEFYKFPSKYYWCTSCRVGNNILVGDMWNSEVESKLFDPINKQWSGVSISAKIEEFCPVHYLNKVWIFGGWERDYEALDTIQIYDPVNKTTSLSPVKMVQARTFHKVIVYNDKLFVFGGANRYDNSLNTVEVYSPDTNKFIMMAPMKIARCDFACCRVGNLVYIIGGVTNGYFTNSVEVYNLDTNEWCVVENFPVAEYDLHACAVNNKLE